MNTLSAMEQQENGSITTVPTPTAIDDLPDPMLIEILSRLPTHKSVVDCKLVCKKWNSLISSSDFASCFITNHATQAEYEKHTTVVQDTEYVSRGMNFFGSPPWSHESSYCTSTFATRLRVIAGAQKNDTVSILASQNDLLLCAARRLDFEYHLGATLWSFCGGSLFLCNPFTMERLDLPETPLYGAMALMCEPYYRIDAQGRYHLRNSNRKFTILCVNRSFSDQQVSKAVHFCSERGTWSKPVGLELRLKANKTNIVAYKGKFYWVGEEAADSTLEHVVVYDPSSVAGSATRFSCFPEIDRSWGRSLPACLGVCNGVLRVMRLFSRDRGGGEYGFTLCVWELKDNNSNAVKLWSLEKCISIDQMISEDSSVLRYNGISLLAFDQSNEDIVYMGLHRSTVSCNLRTRNLEVLTQIPPRVSLFRKIHNMVFPLAQPWWPTPIRP